MSFAHTKYLGKALGIVFSIMIMILFSNTYEKMIENTIIVLHSVYFYYLFKSIHLYIIYYLLNSLI